MVTNYSLVVPDYDPATLQTGVVHIGYGAFHRAHQSLYFDRLAQEQGEMGYGIAVVNLRAADADAFEKATTNLPYVLRSVASDGATEDRVIQVHTQAKDWTRDAQGAEALVALASVQILTITVSEAGYYLNGAGDLDVDHPVIHSEMNGEGQNSIFAYLANGLEARRLAGTGPITVACCDNIRGNGHMLQRAFGQYLKHKGDDALLNWTTANVTFPNSMVDRITPKPPAIDITALEQKLGTDLGQTIMAEDFVQWVLEDNFAGERPSLASVGVTVTTNVEPYEETKIRVLNGGHTALTYMGALAGFETFDQAFVSDELNEHFGKFEQQEVLSALPENLPFDAGDYLATIATRFRNQHIGDTVQRICSDGFAKFPIFIRPTLEGCFQQGQIPIHAIRSIASWVVFSRRVFSDRLEFDYFEPNRERLLPLVQADDLEEFVNNEPLWGDLAAQFPQFQQELERQVALVEQQWPAQ